MAGCISDLPEMSPISRVETESVYVHVNDDGHTVKPILLHSTTVIYLFIQRGKVRFVSNDTTCLLYNSDASDKSRSQHFCGLWILTT